VFMVVPPLKKCFRRRVDVSGRFLETIYIHSNHASGRRDFHSAPDLKTKIFSCGQRKWPHPHPIVHFGA
jgi:hypothetical protein